MRTKLLHWDATMTANPEQCSSTFKVLCAHKSVCKVFLVCVALCASSCLYYVVTSDCVCDCGQHWCDIEQQSALHTT